MKWQPLIGSIIGVLIGVATLVGLGFWWFNLQLSAKQIGSVDNVRIVIPKGASSATVAKLLAQEGVIRNAQFFSMYARWKDLNAVLQPGSYEVSPGMDADQLLAVFKTEAKDIWVTIPEGLRTEEIAELFANKQLPDFDPEEFVAVAKASEGRLFPDTYLVPKLITATQVYDLLTTTFHEKVELDLQQEISTNQRSLDEIITIASLVQREGRTPEDMRMIAGIIDNRLSIGMKLDLDATLSYMRGYDQLKNSWWSAPDVSLKQLSSPYNTYVYAGLPPTPIANPGIDAIKAVLEPTPSNNMFYLHAPSGEAYYAATLDEHSANINRYLR